MNKVAKKVASPKAAPKKVAVKKSVAKPKPKAKVKAATLLELRGIHRQFKAGHGIVHILKDASLDIPLGSRTAIIGPSGSGKSTLLYLMGLLDKPTSGQVVYNGKPTAKLSDAQRSAIRNQDFGFVYQYHHLLPEFSALDNVAMPALIAGKPRKASLERAKALLDAVDMAHRADHFPQMLSGGEQQRVALARALMNKPKLLLADEPTGNLDQTTAHKVMQLFEKLTAEEGLTVVLVTHNIELAKTCDQVFEMVEGSLKRR